MEKNIFTDKIQEFLKTIERKLVASNQSDKRDYLEEYESYLLDSFQNKYQNNYSEENINSFFLSLESPDKIADEFNKAYYIEKEETNEPKIGVIVRINELFDKFLAHKPIRLSILLGIVINLVAIGIYNFTIGPFRNISILAVILLIIFAGFMLYNYIKQTKFFVNAILLVFLYLTTALLLNTILEFLFIHFFGHSINQYFTNEYDSLGYQAIFISFPYYMEPYFNLGTEMSPLYILMVLLLMIALSCIIPIIAKIIQKGSIKKQKRYFTAVIIITIVLLGILLPITDFMNGNAFQPVKQKDGIFFNYSGFYSYPFNYFPGPGNITFGSTPEFSVKAPAWVMSVFFGSYPNIYTIGYAGSPVLQADSLNNSHSLTNLYPIIGNSYNPLPQDFPGQLNLSLTLNSSIFSNYKYYYYQNATNQVILYEYPYYLQEEFNSTVVIDKVYDLSVNKFVYYAQGNRTNFNNTAVSTGFSLALSNLYRSYNINDLQMQFQYDIGIIGVVMVATFLGIIGLEKYKRKIKK